MKSPLTISTALPEHLNQNHRLTISTAVPEHVESDLPAILAHASSQLSKNGGLHMEKLKGKRESGGVVVICGSSSTALWRSDMGEDDPTSTLKR